MQTRANNKQTLLSKMNYLDGFRRTTKQLEARRLQSNALEQPQLVSTDKHMDFHPRREGRNKHVF
jgi:hypothetical protein